MSQAINPQHRGVVVQFPLNDSYLKGRRVEGGPPSGGGDPPLPPESGGGNSGDGGGEIVTDWKATVDARLGELRTDYRNLLIGGLFGIVALAGTMFYTYKDISNDLTALSVKVEAANGTVQTMDAKMSGKFDLVLEKLNDNPQASPRKR